MAWHTIDPHRPPRKAQLTTRQKYALIVASLVAGGLMLGVAAAMFLPQPLARPPATIAEKILFPVYIPSKLPAGYNIPADSFKNVEGALLFDIYGPNGKKMAVSEQSRLKDFDFVTFYRNQLPEAKSLQQVSHQTVYGKGPDGWLMSVLTQDTWIIVSSQQEITEADARTIVNGLVQL